MEKFDWKLVIGKFGEEQRQLQKEQNESSTSWFVWAILSDAYANERRICELASMLRSCEQMILLDEIDAAMTNDYALITVPLSEMALRTRIRSADSKDLTQETMQDAIDCALSRFKKRVLQGNAVSASLEKFVASAMFQGVAVPQIVHRPDNEERVPSVLAVPASDDATYPQEEKTAEENGSCVIA